jgi:hypothetical protein
MAFGQLWASFRPYVEMAFAPLTMFGESMGGRWNARIEFDVGLLSWPRRL